MLTDKELAEKVAEELPTIDDVIFSSHVEIYFQRSDSPIPIPFYKSPDNYTLIGLMVEDAEKDGWEITIQSGYLHFRRIENDKPDVLNLTIGKSIKEHGHVKACALAYIEIERSNNARI